MYTCRAHGHLCWSAVWMLGNLARATYVGSSDFMWPYSYNGCDPKKRKAQEINSCQKVSHYGMVPGLGRGAPEIDLIEAMQGDSQRLPNTNITRPYQSCSLQVWNCINDSSVTVYLRESNLCYDRCRLLPESRMIDHSWGIDLKK
jgi:hypothetical protein